MRRWIQAITLILAFSSAFLFSSALAQADDPYAELWPRIDGSTATQPLTNAIYQHLTGMEASAENPVIIHNKTYAAYGRLFGVEDERHSWYRDSPVDLIFVTEPYAEELEEIGEDYELIPVVKDALVFLNNQQNPLTGLTSEQLRAVYAGEIDDWGALGGQSGQILAYQRPWDSGSQTLFQNLLMGAREPMQAPQEWYIGQMGSLVSAVAAYDNADYALGYSMYYFVANMHVDWRVRMLAVDGVEPIDDSIADGTYPLCTAYYAVFPKSLPEKHPARALVAWLLTDEGQQVARGAGYVLLRPLPEEIAVAPTPKPEPAVALGTGGTESRWGEPLAYSEGAWKHEENKLIASFPQNPALEADINEWLESARRELNNLWELETTINERAVSFHNVLRLRVSAESRVMGEVLWERNHAERIAVYDVAKGRKMKLSDMFYDGFDYHDYIDQIFAAFSLGTEDDFDSFEPDRPYTGVAQDFLFRGGDDRELFVVGMPPYESLVNPQVPLWHGISPFGACKIQLGLTSTEIPGGYRSLVLPTVVVDDGVRPDAEAVINAELARMGEILEAWDWYRYNGQYGPVFQPNMARRGRYWSISYPCVVNYDGNSSWAVCGQVFDLHTGQPLFSSEQALALAGSPQASAWRIPDGKIDRWHSEWEEIPSGAYTPLAGSQVHALFLRNYQNELIIEILEPDNSEVYVSIPLDALNLLEQRYTAEDILPELRK